MRIRSIKIAYLTIDDAPSRDFKHKIEYLESKGIKATFFCQGRFLEERLEEAVDAIRKGHVIGNHSYDHPRFSEITLEEAERQIRRTDELIEEAYRLAGVPRLYRVFRFP
ncbi:MAG: polysaccharide deacetylase, partial [Thermoprotei archaeon]